MENKCKTLVAAYTKKCSLVSIFLLISLFGFFATALAQTRVTGMVRDAQGKAIEGATVTVRGTDRSVATDNAGRYSIEVPGPGSVLVISFVGYTTVEEAVGSRTAIISDLSTSTSDLEQVVV